MAEYVKYEEHHPRVKLFKFGKFSFSTIELKHLLVALVMITLTLMAFSRGYVAQIGWVNYTIISFFTIGLGFLLHEFGHKFVAQHYGFLSEFRADFVMLFIAFAIAWFSPLIFLAPGAVMIHGHLSRRQNGIVSVAGPLVNLTLAILFLLLGFILNPASGSLLEIITRMGVWVNSFLGVFNMLPLWVLDGKKVLAWNKGVYFTVMGALILLLVGSFMGFFI